MAKKRKIIWSPEALKQINRIKRKKSKEEIERMTLRVSELLDDILKNPFKGIGKPEPLKHEFQNCWSRRISITDRLIYRIKDDSIEIISILGHYD